MDQDAIFVTFSDCVTAALVRAVATSVDGNVLIKAWDRDTLSLDHLTATALAGLSADFRFHGRGQGGRSPTSMWWVQPSIARPLVQSIARYAELTNVREMMQLTAPVASIRLKIA